MSRIDRDAASWRLLCFAWVCLAGSACTVRLLAEYDPVLDQKVSELQAGVESFLTQMQEKAGTPEGSYANHGHFYADLSGELVALRARAEVTEKAELFVRHLEKLRESIELLRGLHEKRGQAGLTKGLVEPTRKMLGVQFRALLKLNAELRTGRGGGNE